MLPELFGRRLVADTANVIPRIVPSQAKEHLDCEEENIARLCQEPSFGNMILCDDEECPIKWFHFDCLQMRCPLKIIGIVHPVETI